MFFLSPLNLWLLAVGPLLPLAYVWLLRRRNGAPLTFSNVALVRDAAGRSWKRHVPPALLATACALLLLAAYRGVRIYVVGLGTVDGAVDMPEGMPIYLRLDEPTLREVPASPAVNTTTQAPQNSCAACTKTWARRCKCKNVRPSCRGCCRCWRR